MSGGAASRHPPVEASRSEACTTDRSPCDTRPMEQAAALSEPKPWVGIAVGKIVALLFCIEFWLIVVLALLDLL